MVFKFITLFALMAATNAGLIPAAPLAYAAAPVVTKAIDADYDSHPQYSFAYEVQDSLTGDFKNQHETRDGDVVQGSYSLLEADGTRRIVDYTADSINGFNAVVRKEPAALAVKSAPVAVATPTIAHAPLGYGAQAPIAYATPAIAKVAAPLAYPTHAVYSHSAPALYSAHASAPAVLAAPTYAKLTAPILYH